MEKSSQKGFIKTMIIIVIALIFVKFYFHIDPITFFTSSQFLEVIKTFKLFFISFYNWLDGIIKLIQVKN